MPIDSTLGEIIEWLAPSPPPGDPLRGEWVRLEPVDVDRQAADLFIEAHDPRDPALWTYMFMGPFEDEGSFRAWLETTAESADPYFYTIVDQKTGRAAGMASYCRITPNHGVIEIGNIWFGPSIQRTPQATEAIYLLARHAFDDLGYRRLEWKCDSLNTRSRRAAKRFGFHYEGLFRQHMVVKGRNRDTTWFAITDREWPLTREAFARWLAPQNFDGTGRQRQSLEAIRAALEPAVQETGP